MRVVAVLLVRLASINAFPLVACSKVACVRLPRFWLVVRILLLLLNSSSCEPEPLIRLCPSSPASDPWKPVAATPPVAPSAVARRDLRARQVLWLFILPTAQQRSSRCPNPPLHPSPHEAIITGSTASSPRVLDASQSLGDLDLEGVRQVL